RRPPRPHAGRGDRRRRGRRALRRDPGRAGLGRRDLPGHDAHERVPPRGRPRPGGRRPMIAWFTEAYEPELMRRALAAGLLAGTATAVVGTWVVLRGLTFLGDALAHGVVPGLALAVLWGFSPVLGAFAAALVMSAAVTVVGGRTRVREDTGIGLLFVGMLALGVVIISRAESFTTELTSVLFGDVLGVTPADVRSQAVATALVVTTSVVLHRPFLALTFNRDKAATHGMRPGLAHVALMVLLAVAIVASFRASGTLLVFGLLIGPLATASLLVRRVPLMMATAVGLSALSGVVGPAVSYHHDTARGAPVAGLAVAQFFAVLAVQEVSAAVRRARHRHGA